MNIADLSQEIRDALKEDLQREYERAFDEKLSAFRAETLLDLTLKAVGPAIYNSAVQDVRAHLQTKLDDLDGEIYLDL